jgi:DNA-binding GntR family transcriptional regulator
MANKNNPIKPPQLNVIAYQKIKEFIVTLKLAPGEQVDEERLARILSIGRTPIREALFRLNAEKLVEVLPGRGFFVREITLSSLKDLFETMLILERSAAALAAKRIRSDRLEHLQKLNNDLRRAWQAKNFLKVTLLNSQFHRTIYNATENIFLFSYLDNLQNQSQRLAFMCFSKDIPGYDLESHAQLAINDHQALIELFRQGDDLEAVKVISEHVKLFQRRVNHFLLPSLNGIDHVAQL